jgi:hypothetical protein
MTGWLVVVVVAGLAALVGSGFVVRPRPLPATRSGRPAGTVDLPGGLPTPVARFYAAVGGAVVPRIDTFTLWGRARMRRRPLPPLPLTFRSEHRVGRSGRQWLAVTWYGLPVLRGIDTFLDGHGEMRIGRQRVTGPEIDQGENLFVWAELAVLPATLASRPGIRWEPVDDDTARLRVPFGDGEDELLFDFDPDTGLVSRCRAMRYRVPGGPKVGWEIWYERWRHFPAGRFPARIRVRWVDQARPWFTLDVDGLATNAAIDAELDRVG